MSYTQEQREKNEALISIEMEGCDHQDIADVRLLFLNTWATDDEAKAIIKAKKEEIKLRATPEEMDAIFKDYRV